MSVARFTFGPRLKAHRERQGITLQDIAESTKIGVSLLSSLERNEVAQWPKGIYRRAFLRSYARAIDIPFDPLWAEFVQLFPEDGKAPAASAFTETTQFRLTLAGDARALLPPSTRNVVAAALDLAVVIAFGLLASWLTGLSTWLSLALTSLAYGAASTALAGGSLVQKYLHAQKARQPRTTDHALELVLGAGSGESPALDDDGNVVVAAPISRPRPRIVAVASPRVVRSADTQERRVADR